MLEDLVSIDDDKLRELVERIRALGVPEEQESSTHAFDWKGTREVLANCYFAIVAICHQTSPIGERRLEGTVRAQRKYGWDYLKERFLLRAMREPRWGDPAFWRDLPPLELAALYEDEAAGCTLNRVNERAFLLNDAGQRMLDNGVSKISESFVQHGRRLGGQAGFIGFLRSFEAYRDPVMKKTQFFLSLAIAECGWRVEDPELLSSPVDYHEVRGHLRIGTIRIHEQRLAEKLQRGLSLSEQEDTLVRTKVQQANDAAAEATGLTSSRIHYLLWNVFRNCCPREPALTHCITCGGRCTLPDPYKSMPGYAGRCVFAPVCASANRPDKLVDPPYVGHFY
jgi:hypothetical protein